MHMGNGHVALPHTNEILGNDAYVHPFASLPASDGMLATLVAHLPGALFRRGLNGQMYFLSAGIEALVGIPPADFLSGQCMYPELIYLEDLPRVVDEIGQALAAQRPYSIEYRIQHENGTTRWLTERGQGYWDETGTLVWLDGALFDSTARVEADLARREAEDDVRSIFENAVEGIFRTTPEGKYLRANPALARIYGYPSPEALRAGLTNIAAQLYVEPGRREAFARLIQAQGVVWEFESQVRQLDGQIIWISENAREVCDEHGVLRYYEGTVVDITARKAAEEALHHRQAELNQLVQALTSVIRFGEHVTGVVNRATLAPQAVAFLQAELGLVRVALFGDDGDGMRCLGSAGNHPLEEACELTHGSLLMQARHSGTTTQQSGANGWALATALPDLPPPLQAILILYGDGPMPASQQRLVYTLAASLLARALANVTLYARVERSAIQLQAAAEVGRAASALLDSHALLSTATRLIRTTFGFDEVEVVLASAEPGTSRSPLACEVPLRSGGELLGALRVVPAAGSTLSSDEVAVLQTLADQLAVALNNARAYEQQRAIAEKLRELDQLKSQFLANMSHELRTPLNAIIGFSRVMLKGIDGPVSAAQEQDLLTILNAGRHLLTLIDNILDLSKIEAGKVELALESVAPEALLDEVLGTVQGLVRDRPVRVLREIPMPLAPIVADPIRLRQILLNLLSNAIKFTERGSVRLVAYQTERDLIISISDTGVGIPTEKLPHLFDAFYQVDGSTTRKVGGSGLGLAITRHLIQLHGGSIQVQSSVGAGSTFTVNIPR